MNWLGEAMLTQTLGNQMQSDPCKSRLLIFAQPYH